MQQPDKNVFLTHRVPESMRNAFKKKYPHMGQRSKVIRALLQMLLDNKLPSLEYTTTTKIT
jgi:hypothetical protein